MWRTVCWTTWANSIKNPGSWVIMNYHSNCTAWILWPVDGVGIFAMFNTQVDAVSVLLPSNKLRWVWQQQPNTVLRDSGPVIRPIKIICVLHKIILRLSGSKIIWKFLEPGNHRLWFARPHVALWMSESWEPSSLHHGECPSSLVIRMAHESMFSRCPGPGPLPER